MKNEKFTLTLDLLQYGWADIVIADEQEEVKNFASHILYDALAGWIDIAVYLLKGQSCKRTIYLEPEEISIEAAIASDENIELKIGETTFVCPLLRYARQVLKMFDSYLYQYGTAQYEAEWHHAFPAQQIEVLRMLLREQQI